MSEQPGMRIGELEIDFGKAAGDYARHRAGFPPELFDRLAKGFGIGLPGQRALDLGTGTGTIARQLALRGVETTGLDLSLPLMAQARELDAVAGATVNYVEGRAEGTGLPATSFDVVTAGQCWHWFDAPKAVAEVRRLLKPGGALVICSFDWLPLPGNVVEATERLIVAHNPLWTLGGGLGIHPRYTLDVATAGFRSIETFSFDEDTPYAHEAWRGRIRASAGIAASLSPERVEAFDSELAALLARDFPADPLAVAHRTWALVCRAPE
jgi:SAM-dependent methyltransferase